MSHAGFILEGRSAELWPGRVPAGQLCGTAAIVEQNSFPMTHLSSQFNRNYSSQYFSCPELEENQKRESLLPSFCKELFADPVR